MATNLGDVLMYISQVIKQEPSLLFNRERLCLIVGKISLAEEEMHGFDVESNGLLYILIMLTNCVLFVKGAISYADSLFREKCCSYFARVACALN